MRYFSSPIVWLVIAILGVFGFAFARAHFRVQQAEIIIHYAELQPSTKELEIAEKLSELKASEERLARTFAMYRADIVNRVNAAVAPLDETIIDCETAAAQGGEDAATWHHLAQILNQHSTRMHRAMKDLEK